MGTAMRWSPGAAIVPSQLNQRQNDLERVRNTECWNAGNYLIHMETPKPSSRRAHLTDDDRFPKRMVACRSSRELHNSYPTLVRLHKILMQGLDSVTLFRWRQLKPISGDNFVVTCDWASKP